MKNNGNDKRTGAYYLGLDVGTNSVGWAVTDKNYNILKFKENAMWGARLFDEAEDASGRRANRTNRRRLARRHQRLLLLEMLFAKAVNEVDPNFFRRLEESGLWLEDKTDKECHFALFNDPAFTDKDYHRRYPTIYHLRAELANATEPHDVRLVYLAIHHIMKSRGHFLYETSESQDEIRSLDMSVADLEQYLSDTYGITLQIHDHAVFTGTMLRNDIGITEKKRLLHECCTEPDESDEISLNALIDMLSGAKVKLATLFSDETLANAEITSLSLKGDLDEQFEQLAEILNERAELLLRMKDVYDTALLTNMLNGEKTISAAKIAQYDKNYKDLRILKKYVREAIPEQYKEIFTVRKDKLNNYAAYSGYRKQSGMHTCSQEDFCKYLRKVLPEPKEAGEEIIEIYREISDGVFLPKLKGTVNGVIPYQLQRQELRMILANAATYLPFLNECDPDGNTIKEKIEKTFEFRIPYYVGPLNSKAGKYWAVRFPDRAGHKIYPWNFTDVIDTEASAGAFMEELIGRCTYTGERVLPKDSLLYSEYMLLNELNTIRIDGRELPILIKNKLIDDLFKNSRKRVTKKQIEKYLICEGAMLPSENLTGIDDVIKTSLKSYHDFKRILDKTGDQEMVENIIRQLLVFSDDKVMLKKWLRKNTHGLDESDYSYICRLKYSDWGRLSKTLLTEIYSIDPSEGTGEAHSIIHMLRNTNQNLMQLMSDRYQFAVNSEQYRNEIFGNGQTLTEKLDALYIAPAVRRSIRQTMRIVDEIVDCRKAVPEKIFIEMARGSAEDMHGKRTESRKAKLLALYANCKNEAAELLPKLEKEDDNRLRSDKLFLYYSQFGKCMYSGEPIDLEALMDGRLFDIDHIYPQSRIKDNSLDNRVVVKNTLNREKSNEYPIKGEIRGNMRPFWTMLKDTGMISEKKYDRLVRANGLTDEELASFVARQLIETQQSTKALATILKDTYGEATRIVFSKAGNVSDFRQQFDLLKCREVNDLHHAKDAYLNIVVGNVYCTRFTDRFFANIQHENYSLNRVFEYDIPGAWDRKNSIKTVKSFMAKNNPIITKAPVEAKGQLFDLQLMPAGKGQLEKKLGLLVEKYGGYNKIAGAYFCVVEHTEKKKRIRTIEPVYLYQKERYEKNPKLYAEEILHLVDPVIICKTIRINALVELDGLRLNITGRTGNRILLEHSFQLAIDDASTDYIRKLAKYLERCKARRTELPITEFDGITREKNLQLYSFFLKKLQSPCYGALFASLYSDMQNSVNTFEEMSLYHQTVILLEILKAFRCNAQKPDFTLLCGKGSVGAILKNKNISQLSSAYLVHQSVTGLFEVRENLLQ